MLERIRRDSELTRNKAQAHARFKPLLAVNEEPVDFLQSLINAAPGCYPGDDGSGDMADRYNFFAHRKRFLFSPCSLGYFRESNRFRQAVIWCITWKRFDQFILFLIFANSLILALADYSKVNEQGDLDSSQSFRNAIVNSANNIFTILFSVECSMRIIAMGLFGEQGAYLMDPWNCMDFIVLGYNYGVVYCILVVASHPYHFA
ncbi:hypothetical protein BBJ29_007592 [Phytophthora kernoviae]|uniref:Ion transport domain-containing protein n=1 Tax=Phytophthora kernoviae TaxID=325452 RepID=A0A3F2REU4_9STRA|nr:hypothetical protein BBP00_00008777 [Phytophthora kernoviae]RLN65087.1 hypothetical protein BBJ29_007592 [Phytophthora kernoviae]